MNIFKRILNKLKSQGNIRSFALDDDDDEVDTKELTESGFGVKNENNNMSVFSSTLARLSDLAKSYLFQIKFDFENEDLNLFSDDLSLRAKSVNILPITSAPYYPDTNTHGLPPDSEFCIKFDEFEDYLGWNFWFKYITQLHKDGFNIEVTMYDSKLKNVIKKVQYNYVKPTYVSELILDMNADNKVTYYVKFNAASITNLV